MSIASDAAAKDVALVRKRRFRRTKWATILLCLLPAAALYVVFVLIPILQAAFYSTFAWNGYGPATDQVGIANYQEILASPIFQSGLTHNVVLVLLSIAIQLPFALALAMMLNQRFRGRAFFRLLFFVPYVLSEVVTAVIFQLLLQPGGLASSVAANFGLASNDTAWLADTTLVLPALFLVISWKYFGFHMILYLAGLQAIPRDLLEAAEIDGANSWDKFRHVTFPLLGPTVRVSAFLSIIGSIQLFDLVYVMTQGGPVNASNTMATYMLDFGLGRRHQVGFGSAVAVIIFVISFAFALAYQRWVLRRDMEGATTTLEG